MLYSLFGCLILIFMEMCGTYPDTRDKPIPWGEGVSTQGSLDSMCCYMQLNKQGLPYCCTQYKDQY